MPLRGVVKEKLKDNKFRVAYENGKQKVFGFEKLIALLNKEDEQDIERCSFDQILNH